MSNFPYLVQRVQRNLYPASVTAKGVDHFFTFDYMGSSEFEWGALPNALKAMRACSTVISKPIIDRMSRPDAVVVSATAHYVGPEECEADAMAFFSDQLKPAGSRVARLKEHSGLCDSYTGLNVYNRSVIGWWALTDAPWILFKREVDATQWVKAL